VADYTLQKKVLCDVSVRLANIVALILIDVPFWTFRNLVIDVQIMLGSWNVNLIEGLRVFPNGFGSGIHITYVALLEVE
jgi:hypothetical protein